MRAPATRPEGRAPGTRPEGRATGTRPEGRATGTRPQGRAPGDVTLLELVQAVAEVTDDEREIVATVMCMLRSGHARLIGNFRDASFDDW